jgi:hypothetical protein
MAVFAACDPVILKVHGDDADLQGKWRMEGDSVFFNFQKNLFQIQDFTRGRSLSQYGYYLLEGDTAITLEALLNTQPVHERFLKWDTVNVEGGIAKAVCRCRVDEINNKRLVISLDDEILSFYKF